VASAALTPWVRGFCVARGWYSFPSSERHIHTRPIPRLGGVAIFATLWCMALLAWAAGHFAVRGFVFPQGTFKILGPATIVFVVGLIDDFRGLGPYVKFVAQAGAAVLLFCNGFGITRLSLLAGHPDLGWLVGLPLTILWILWITNAFNLIDGLDGLAAGSALFSTVVTCVAAICFHNEGILLLAFTLAGAIAGFLRYNFNPASIFLGDCGSLLIGFLLGAIALAGSQKAPTMAAVAIPIVSLGLPILDVTVAVLRRFLSCKGLFHADCEHIHHKLLRRGVSHRQAVLVLYGVSACFGLLSLFLLHPAGALVFGVLVVIGIGVVLGVQQLGYLEFLELGRVANRALKQRHVIANDVNIRRASEALESCTSLLQFCQIMRECLKPAGFDGFGLYLNSEVPPETEVYPLTRVRGSKLRFFWSNSLRLSAPPNWSLSLSLAKSNGERLGNFALYRKNTAAPLLIDLEVFTATGFSEAVAAAVEKVQESWFAKAPRERTPVPGLRAPRPVIGSRVARAMEAPSSG
jgi:UDP-GlcNAc:undecaprenyl-phosphate/decaprenyl-phosphate GlcNAc-1-phosphate transferase